MENIELCHCKKVTYADVERVMHEATDLASVTAAFDEVQAVTHCSTGCGGCHDKIMDVISDILHY